MIYIVLFLISFILTYLIKDYAIKKSLLADVNERSSHTVPTPHGGGIAIAISWFAGLTYLYSIEQIESSLFYALLVGVIISMVSFFDDIFDLLPKFRILIQALVAVCGLVAMGGLESVNFGFFAIENQILTNLFAFLMIVWFINLYNFLDGIDGYAGSEALFLALAGFVLFGGGHFVVLAVSVLGFLIWNWHRAKIFMGDVGSTLLGYTVAIFTIHYANEASQNLWIWIILFALFWFDATLTLFRRYKNGEKLSQAHKKHAYQRLTQSGLSHERVVVASIMVNIVLFLVIYFIDNIFIAFTVACMILYSVMRYVDGKKRFA
ncbi:glycosyltransferase family 4 protein [Sulfurimonas sp.]|jgi:Fuc2NAc and GlcNAc transferase|uniref:MraY family glycosyltransferase n=1 Tax=Sulfurimonas sp. TaxID=2022749 RepID=UPI0025F1E2DE|nr:glycosyltransferase family 4 protein [Sulfurimonas sp.]MCK9472248.1 glycosyltransferase family 4 protein [Sulfurimonas sp.]